MTPVALKVLHQKIGYKAREVSKILTIAQLEQTRQICAKQHFFRECSLWMTLSHPNIVPFLGIAIESENSLAMVSPFFAFGDLRTYLQQHGEDVDRLKLVFG